MYNDIYEDSNGMIIVQLSGNVSPGVRYIRLLIYIYIYIRSLILENIMKKQWFTNARRSAASKPAQPVGSSAAISDSVEKTSKKL